MKGYNKSDLLRHGWQSALDTQTLPLAGFFFSSIELAECEAYIVNIYPYILWLWSMDARANQKPYTVGGEPDSFSSEAFFFIVVRVHTISSALAPAGSVYIYMLYTYCLILLYTTTSSSGWYKRHIVYCISRRATSYLYVLLYVRRLRRIFRFNSFPPVILIETFDCLCNKLPKNGPSRVGNLERKKIYQIQKKRELAAVVCLWG